MCLRLHKKSRVSLFVGMARNCSRAESSCDKNPYLTLTAFLRGYAVFAFNKTGWCHTVKIEVISNDFGVKKLQLSKKIIQQKLGKVNRRTTCRLNSKRRSSC